MLPLGAPALPLDEAGKYVAGAYIVFLVLLVVYVAIMAAKLQRIERELRDLAAFAETRSEIDAPSVEAERATPDAEARSSPSLFLLLRARAEEVAPDMSELLALGVSHKTAPLDLRERLSLTEGSAVGALRELTASEGIHEAAAISTCNRTELYLVVSDTVEAESTALGVLTRQADIPPTELLGHLYSRRGTDAAHHLFRVTAGLDSMVVGEAEIQGQVKRAYELALVEGATGPILNRLFRGALAAGGRVREETEIGRRNLSIPSVAVDLARRTLGDLGRAARPRRRRRRDGGAGRPGAGRAGRHHGLRRQPALRPRDRPCAALRGRRRALRGASRAAAERRHRRQRDPLAPPHRRAGRARRGDGDARRPAADAGRHRRAARHRARLPGARRRQPP